MGHKAHPIGLRLGIHRKWKSNWFFESKNYANFIHLNLNIEKFFKGFLYFYGIKTLLLKCQLIKLASNQIFIFVFYYRFRKKLKKTVYKWKINKWKSNLEDYFAKNNLNNQYYPFLNHVSKKFFFKNLKIMVQKLTMKQNVFIKNSLFTNFIKKSNLKNNFKIYQELKNIYLTKFLELKFIFKYLKNFKTYNLNLKTILLKLKIRISQTIFLLKSLKKTSKILLQTQNLNYFFIKKNFYNFLFYKKFFENKEKSLSICNSNFSLKKYIFLNTFLKQIALKNYYFKFIFGKKTSFKINSLKLNFKKKKKNILITKKQFFLTIPEIKKFLSKITNSKINLIFINTLSFTKFFYLISEQKNKKKEKFNIIKIQKLMLNKFKYNAIFIKDFIHLAFITVLLKTPTSLVQFIAEQFKRLPKNRKQLKLLTFITQSLKIFCQQRKEFLGFKFQLKGRLNRRNRTNKWTFQKGILPIQTYKTRVEYAYTEGFTRSGLIGIKLWFFYKKKFKKVLKTKLLQYLYYSKYKQYLNTNLISTPNSNNFFSKKKNFNNIKSKYVKAKSKKISKK